ncbi:unnamed protein product [Discosporangium mesarthrocarpum]
MVAAYHQVAKTLNLLRAFAGGGYADINRLHAWNMEFVENTEEGSKYRELATKIEDTLRFMKAIGVDTKAAMFKQTSFYTAHEALLLNYEEALTRLDSTTGEGGEEAEDLAVAVAVCGKRDDWGALFSSVLCCAVQ